MSNKIQRVFPKNIPAAIGPYSPVTNIGNTYYVSGQLPVNPKTSQIVSSNIKDQAHQVMKNIQNALKGCNLGFSDIVKTTILLTDINNFSQINEVYGGYFKSGQYPARICYAVAALPKNSLIEIDAIAFKSEGVSSKQNKQKKQAKSEKPKKAKTDKNAKKVRKSKKAKLQAQVSSKAKIIKPTKTKKIRK